MSKVKIDSILYYKLLHEASNYIDSQEFEDSYSMPRVYLLGEDKNGIIVDARKLGARYGCNEMPTIPRPSLDRAMRELAEQGLASKGLARMGTFNHHLSGASGDVPYDLGQFGMFLLSLGTFEGRNGDCNEKFKIKVHKYKQPTNVDGDWYGKFEELKCEIV